MVRCLVFGWVKRQVKGWERVSLKNLVFDLLKCRVRVMVAVGSRDIGLNIGQDDGFANLGRDLVQGWMKG